ncbi:inositol monophosphatase family protein [Nocardia australiensis]|uniref:inositol monophosphatase family protein n=1 Tax=Nocardia australiensis TaxID=2887191 RepID=UPI001D15331D|nr:inositol monophosphatase [Nocardia australiensis]
MRTGEVMNLPLSLDDRAPILQGSIDLPDTVVAAAAGVAIRAATEAGRTIHAGLAGALTVRTKDASGDLVTDLDLRAEHIIVTHIRRAFPSHRILAEESGLLDSTDDAWCWVVDPLDGTNNIAIGLPVCTVGIALCHHGIPVLGVVHEPLADRTWSATRGGGAIGPAGPLSHPPRRGSQSAPTFAWVQGYPVTRGDPTARALRLALESGSRRLIQLWSPLLCWIMLSRGDIDGFVGYRAGLVDLPAGTLIAQESGIDITAFDGTPLAERLDPTGGELDFIAAAPDMLSELTLLVKSAAEVSVTGLPASR